MIKYRVVIKVSYNEAWFDFENAQQAGDFAAIALKHMVPSEDQRKSSYITIRVVDPEAKKGEEEEEETE